jgi:hypothetical protein
MNQRFGEVSTPFSGSKINRASIPRASRWMGRILQKLETLKTAVVRTSQADRSEAQLKNIHYIKRFTFCIACMSKCIAYAVK